MADLRTNYKDDILDTSVNTQRKYQIINNSDGTVSFIDVTDYEQFGDSFGAADVNAINEAVNTVNTVLSPIADNQWKREQISNFAFPYTAEQNGLLTLMISMGVGDCYLYVNPSGGSTPVARVRAYGKDSGTWATVTFPVAKGTTYIANTQTGIDNIIAILYTLG